MSIGISIKMCSSWRVPAAGRSALTLIIAAKPNKIGSYDLPDSRAEKSIAELITELFNVTRVLFGDQTLSFGVVKISVMPFD